MRRGRKDNLRLTSTCTCPKSPLLFVASGGSDGSGASPQSSFISCSVARSGEPLLRDCLEALTGLRLRLDLGLPAIVVGREMWSSQRWGINIEKERRSINDDTIESCKHSPVI